jgi:hypothetical protein
MYGAIHHHKPFLRDLHDEEGRRAVIEIDDREFTLEEFGTMLTIFSGREIDDKLSPPEIGGG